MTTTIMPVPSDEQALSAKSRERDAADAQRDRSVQPTAEQLRYARVLEISMRTGLTCLAVTFGLYVLGVMSPHVPLEKINACLALSAHEYQQQANVEPGWGWVALLGHGDFVNFIGITMLASVTIVCYLAILPQMFKRRDLIYAALAVVQIAVLVLAASGLLAVGH